MRVRLVASAAVLAMVLAVLLLRGPGPGASARPPERATRAPESSPSPISDPGPSWPERDPFRYADQRPPGGASARPVSPVTPPTLRPDPPAAPSLRPLRLIGLVRQGERLKAALSLWGETVVLGEGEEARGYRVLSVDEERGVRLRGPDGAELDLGPS